VVIGEGGPQEPLAIPEYIAKTPSFRSLVLGDDNRIYLRVVNRVDRYGTPVSVVTCVPVTAELLARVVRDECLVTMQPPDREAKPNPQPATTTPGGGAKIGPTKPDQSGLKFTFGVQKQHSVVTVQGTRGSAQVSAGKVQPARGRLDYELAFGTALNLKDWSSGESATGFLAVHTRTSTLYDRLFRTLGEFSNYVMSALIVIAILFALIELVALFIGVRLRAP
jgi:hypothetical protein